MLFACQSVVAFYGYQQATFSFAQNSYIDTVQAKSFAQKFHILRFLSDPSIGK